MRAVVCGRGRRRRLVGRLASLALLLLLLGGAGCAKLRTAHANPVSCNLAGCRRTLGAGLLTCESAWTDTTTTLPLDAAGGSGVPKVRVAVHLMEATLPNLTPDDRQKRHREEPHFIAPVEGAVSHSWLPALSEFFGPGGKVSQFWRSHDIQLSLFAVEKCMYNPGMLRLESTDGDPCGGNRRACRDSIFFPDHTHVVAVPWAGQVFQDVNRLFTREEPNVLHVLAWWAVGETATDTNLPLLGYARAAGRGGPAAWVYTFQCTDPPSSYATCARMLAHEIGHVFGLHHVQKGDVQTWKTNLMLKEYPSYDLEHWQSAEALDEARRWFNSR